MNHYPPHIEIISEPSDLPPPIPIKRWYRTRLAIFLVMFTTASATGLIYNYSRPAVYRSTATLLTSAPAAIDAAVAETDIQHVAIQKQILLGRELLDETLKRLAMTHPDARLTLADAKALLQVKPVADTHLVEMRAEGSSPEILPALINTWIDVYLDARAAEVETSKAQTVQIVKDELAEQEKKIAAARTALTEFRNTYDISSTERQENAVLARLNGLTAALNNASEAEVKAKARLNAVEKAIAEGQAVVPSDEQRTLENLEQRLQQLQEKLAEFDQRYTREYLAKQPSMRYLPEEIKKLEREIESKRHFGKRIVHTDAAQEYEAAKMTLARIRRQLDEHKRMASEFSARFAQHESLKADLDGLEKIYRETQERLVQVESRPVDKYPQVTVIDRAFLSREPISPDYNRDALIVVTGSVLLGLFAVWIAEFLTPSARRQPEWAVSNIPSYRDFGLNRLDLPSISPERLEQIRNHNRRLPTFVRELTDTDLIALLEAANAIGKQLIALLLSGATLEEAAALTPDDLNVENRTIRLPGTEARIVPIDDRSIYLMNGHDKFPSWHTENPLTTDDLSAILSVAAIDAGLSHPEEINAEAIRHTYIVYLIRQGLKLSELEKIVGPIPPTKLVEYGRYSPPRPGLSFDEIDRMHPALTHKPKLSAD